MESRSIILASGRVGYLAQTTSWHPTFEVLFVSRGRASTAFFEDVAGALATYGDVYLLDLKGFGASSPAEEVEGVLEWTKATHVRKPLFVSCPASFETTARFAGAAPQFTLGLVVVPGERPTPAAGAPRLVALVGGVLRAISTIVRRPVEPDVEEIVSTLAELEVPHLDATDEGTAAAVATRIRTFAYAIKPSSPASERRPLRPWASERAGREA